MLYPKDDQQQDKKPPRGDASLGVGPVKRMTTTYASKSAGRSVRIGTDTVRADHLKMLAVRHLEGKGKGHFLAEPGGRKTLAVVEATLKRGRRLSRAERKAVRMQVDSNHNLPKKG